MPEQGAPAYSYFPTAFIFEGEPDRNMNLNWLGPIPRVGEHLVLSGRDRVWKVRRVEWFLEPRLKDGLLNRAVKVFLVEDKPEKETT